MLGVANRMSANSDTEHISDSDARSASVVDERIRPALESGATVGSSKPTLVIIDEIDGATGGAAENVRVFSFVIHLYPNANQECSLLDS